MTARPSEEPDLRLTLSLPPSVALVVEPLGMEYSPSAEKAIVIVWWHDGEEPAAEVVHEESLLAVNVIEARYYEVWRGKELLEEGGFPPRR